MPGFLIQRAASLRIDEIYRYTCKQWGEERADTYINGLFETFERVGTHDVFSHPIPAEFGVDGFFYKYERHFVYWKYLSDRQIGIVTVLHERMHQIGRFKDVFGNERE